MTRTRVHGMVGGTVLMLALLGVTPVLAQTFSSGSTGSLGALNPAGNITVTLPADGILNYTTVTIGSGKIVTFLKNANNTPVTMLATGDVSITGTISVPGANGLAASGGGGAVNAGALGGPGGFAGGNGGSRGVTNNNPAGGQGPGGAVLNSSNGTYGNASFVSLLPLFGGSGGSGGPGNSTTSGGAGGGGGGSIVIASSTQVIVNAGGSILANGGTGGAGNPCNNFFGGGGSGGAIRVVSLKVTNLGTIQANGGAGGCGAAGQAGRVRIESFVTGTILNTTPTPSIVTSPGPVTAASRPALISLPTLTISTVGGVTVPANPAGSYTTADVTLPGGAPNPVTINITATNIPVGTVFTLKLLPQFAASSSVNSAASTGTFSSSTTSAIITFPLSQISLLNSYGLFTLP